MDVNLYELIDLVHVPGVNRELTASLKKWEKMGIDSLETEYGNYRDAFYKELVHESSPGETGAEPGMTFNFLHWPGKIARALNPEGMDSPDSQDRKDGDLFPDSVNPVNPVYPVHRFELQQYDHWKWRLVGLNPLPPPGRHFTEVLPTDIIDRLAEEPVDPEKVVILNKVRSNVLHKTVDVRCVRYSSTHIFGVVKGYPPDNLEWHGDMETAMAAFFAYREKFPRKTYRFVSEFLNGKEIPLSPLTPLTPRTSPTPPKMGGNSRDGIDAGAAAGVDVDTCPWEKPVKDIPEARFFPKDRANRDRPGLMPGVPGLREGGSVNLYHLIRLAKIPEFNRLLLLKLEELKNGPVKDEINDYRRWCNYYRDTMRRCLDANTSPSHELILPYRFILTEFVPGDWGVTRVAPWPPKFEHYKRIIPEAVFPGLTQTPVDPAQVWRAEVDVSTPWKKRMRYTWVRYSENCVMGMAYESVADLIAKPRSQDSLDWPDKDLYRLLFYMMRHVPGSAEAFAHGFMKTCYRDCLEGEHAT